jgi:hypothetical protein
MPEPWHPAQRLDAPVFDPFLHKHHQNIHLSSLVYKQIENQNKAMPGENNQLIMDKKEAILHSSQGKDGVIVHHTYHYT